MTGLVVFVTISLAVCTVGDAATICLAAATSAWKAAVR